MLAIPSLAQGDFVTVLHPALIPPVGAQRPARPRTLRRGVIVDELGNGRVEMFALDTSEQALYALCRGLFEHCWQELVFGILIQGAAWEIRAPGAPQRIGLLDGYLTVDFGVWHFHICIGAHQGTRKAPTPPELARIRRTSRAELYRLLDAADAPMTWGLRLFNGNGEQQMNVFFPNPFLTEAGKITRSPDWNRLAVWDRVRKQALGLAPDARDRSSKGFWHP